MTGAGARVHEIKVSGLPPVPTPAPLLSTRRGQFPNLPSELLPLALPKGQAPLLLQLPLLDWHTLNPNTPLHGKDLLPLLRERASTVAGAGSGDGSFEGCYAHGIGGYCGQKNAVLFLCNRAAGSGELVHEGVGKSTKVTAEGKSRKESILPGDVVRLHEALGTHFMTSLSDSAWLPVRSEGSGRRRAERSVKQFRESVEVVREVGVRGMIGSVQGGDNISERVKCAREVCEIAGEKFLSGYSIDGLYAGEGEDARWACVEAVVEAIGEGELLRVLSGGDGGPIEVLKAVRRGVDVVESVFPFEAARCGIATDISEGGRVNCRERKWVGWRGKLVEGCKCGVCNGGFSRGYVRHLFEVHEMMGVTLVAAHNLWDYLSWFDKVRQAVQDGTLERFASEFEQVRARNRVSSR